MYLKLFLLIKHYSDFKAVKGTSTSKTTVAIITQAGQALHDGKSKESLWSIHMLFTISANSVAEELTFLWRAACQLRYILAKRFMRVRRSLSLRLNLKVI